MVHQAVGKAAAVTIADANLLAIINNTQEYCEAWREELLTKRKQKPYIRIWKNKDDGTPGLEYVGRIHYDDTIRASFSSAKTIDTGRVGDPHRSLHL